MNRMILVGWRCALLAVMVALQLSAVDAGAQTLRSVVAQSGIRMDPADVRGDRAISNYATGDAAGVFAIAYYEGNGSTLPDSLSISVLNRATGAWIHRNFPRDKSETPSNPRMYSAGSAVRVSFSARHIFVDTHRTPSAGFLFVFTRDVQLVDVISGWTSFLLPGGSVVYERNMVHFAPTHPAELWIYHPDQRRDVLLYPKQPYDSARAGYIERMRGLYSQIGSDWFRINNHHMKAELFTSSIGEPVSDSTGSRIAFLVEFGGDSRLPVTAPVQQVVVVCDGVTGVGRCSERDVTQLRRGTAAGMSDADILSAAIRRLPPFDRE